MNDERILGYMAGDGRFWITSFIEDEEDNCCYACDTDSSLGKIFERSEEAEKAAVNAFGMFAKVYVIEASQIDRRGI